MHASSLENMQKCYERYVKNHYTNIVSPVLVVDIGGANVNGSYADIFSELPFNYKAADIDTNSKVDIILDTPYKLPFIDNSIDILVSGQTFEHVEFFWLLFEEMVRVLKKSGLIFLIAPSSGPIHQYPVDCYRFYPDSYTALANYSNCYLVDTWLDDRGPWNDLVGVFSKTQIAKFDYTGSNSTHNFSLNRYEKSTAFIFNVSKHENSNYEILKGSCSYLDTLKRLHCVINPELYLEIGVRQGKSLKLATCHTIGIDPLPDLQTEIHDNHVLLEMTSDDFFEFKAKKVLNKNVIDLAFIDGMHLFEFVLRDFINIEEYSSPETVVVIDDIYPNHPIQARRVRSTAAWTGDVWKLGKCLKQHRPDLSLTYLDTYPTGLLVITGLQCTNRTLKNRYNPIFNKFRGMKLCGENEEKIINRSESISPENQLFWKKLAFLKTNGLSEKKRA